MRYLIIIFTALLSMSYASAQSPLATPNAKGLGANTKGALGSDENPTILYVDRLVDDLSNDGNDHGSFRWCVTRAYPRIIVFEVSGYITLSTSLTVTEPYMSIYGQTAPDPGITITGEWYLDLREHDYIIQHMRFRPSYGGTEQRDALSLARVQNVFIDNCSFSYCIDELVGLSGAEDDIGKTVTVMDCILSWPVGYSSGKGLLAGDNTDSLSVIQNAFIHCADRSPYPNGEDYCKVEVVNNYAYNPAYWGCSFSGGTSTAEISALGNVYKYGPSTASQIDRQVIRLRQWMTEGVSVYLDGNYSTRRVSETSEWDGVVYYEDDRDSTDYKVDVPFDWIEPAEWDYTVLADSLVSRAGARPWDRDLVDIDALNDMVNGTGVRIDDIEDAYYPALDSFYLEVPIPDDPFDLAGNGFTNFENWVETYEPDPVDDPCASTTISLSAVVTSTVGGDATGTISLTVDGGLEPYTYLWSNGATTQNLSGIVAGYYTVVVTDNNTCTGNDTYTVNDIDPCDTTSLILSANITNIIGDGATGAIDVSVTGGLAPYTYEWSNGGTESSINNVEAGSYTITVTDDNSCTAEETYSVTNIYDYFMIVDDNIIILNDSVLIIKH